MKRLSLLFGVVLSLLFASTAVAAPKLKPFGSADVTIGPGGVVTIVADHEDDPVWGGPEYGGIYSTSKNSGKLLAAVDLGFTNSGDIGGGAPRLSVPVDTNGDGRSDFYAFLSADRCGAVEGQPHRVSTENPACIVDLNNGQTFANWDAFAAAYPTARVAPGDPVFIVADGSYDKEYVISEIDLS